MTDPEKLRDRLISKRLIDPETKCWIWTGAKTRGVGHILVDGKNLQINRLAVALWTGAALDAEHLAIPSCGNRSCFNPAHLRGKTKSEFCRQTQTRSHCPVGHSMSAENTYVDPRGWRHCRACRFKFRKTYAARRRPTSCASRGKPFVSGDPRINMSGKSAGLRRPELAGSCQSS